MHFIIWLIGSLLGKTWRITIHDPHCIDIYNDRGKKRVYCFWHAHLLVTAFTFRHTGKAAMVSSSKDGQLAASVARRWGYDIVTGSSTRGGSAALRESLRLLRNNQCVGITPDGPRGPKRKAKNGVAQIAQQAGADVVAIRMKADRFWQLKSWDGFIIPKPFARIRFILGPLLPPPPKPVTTSSVAQFIQQIENSLATNETMA